MLKTKHEVREPVSGAEPAGSMGRALLPVGKRA